MRQLFRRPLVFVAPLAISLVLVIGFWATSGSAFSTLAVATPFAGAIITAAPPPGEPPFPVAGQSNAPAPTWTPYPSPVITRLILSPSDRFGFLTQLDLTPARLASLSPEQLERLAEFNAERLRFVGGRIVRRSDGTEEQVEFGQPIHLQNLCPAIQKGVDFLEKQYVSEIGLYRESPITAPRRAWIANDNTLAVYALSKIGLVDRALQTTALLHQQGSTLNNGLIEVLWGVPVDYPPHVEKTSEIPQIGAMEIWQESHLDGATFDDWREYTNLALLGALNEYLRGNPDQARTIYQQTLTQFDGNGFRDKSYRTHYETYKLTLALYVGVQIGVPPPPSVAATLLKMQAPDGGFVTLYRDSDHPEGDANTETTSLAMLALATYGCTPP